ncbi:MAG TPA: AI-2E family transporter [Cyclobacteriaceae bacterium]|jgi:predicted PurR-regulated permease PerM|nr:AI-2E family transporter [Cyclobacteriaceae bacterium]
MEDHTSRPFYLRLSLNLISLFIICLALIYGRSIILPLLFGILLANLLLPLTQYLYNKKFNKLLTIIIPLMATLVVCVGLLFIVSDQVINFVDDIPALKKRYDEVSTSGQRWIRENTHMTIQKQNQYLSNGVENLKEQIPELLGATFSSLKEIVTYTFLVPIYAFLVLYYRRTIKHFLIRIFKNGSEEKVRAVLSESTTVAHRYIIGLLIETTLVFSLNLIGFFFLGIKYKFLLALLAALLNLVPYLGILVANIFCMLTTMVTSSDPTDILWVGIILAVVQIFDNNFGMPLIVGNKVRINSMITIIGVIAGGTLCGIAGMFMAIPVLAVLKIVFDKVPELQPWGMLLGDDPGEKNLTGTLDEIKISI